MKTYLYLSVIPEALVASHLAPADFGAYLATGSQKRARGQAIFFKLTDAYAAERIAKAGLGDNLGRPEGEYPRKSAYLGIYRVLEEVPVEAIESLYLVTEDGRSLAIAPADYTPEIGPRFHLYQQFSPVTPRIVSQLEPREFVRHITDKTKRVALPAIVFAELELGRLADDPEAEGVDNLPYPNIPHLRDCIRELRAFNKTTKTVIRFLGQDVLFRTLHRGFYYGNDDGGFLYFPLPSIEQLEREFYPWWRSANTTFGG
ncbi:MAG: hypothetical protein LBR12_03635 [Opitutaceae bacterium]|nr:hypothetical protein [Opitutaceae bacterium]